MEIKSFSKENNVFLVGGLQEYLDLTAVDSCKDKGFQTVKYATTNHTPPSPCLSKCFVETLWVFSELWVA